MSNASVVATNSHPKTRFQAKIADAIFRQDQFHQSVAMDQYLPVESRVQTWHFQDRSYDPMHWVGPFLPRNLNFWWIYQLKKGFLISGMLTEFQVCTSLDWLNIGSDPTHCKSSKFLWCHFWQVLAKLHDLLRVLNCREAWNGYPFPSSVWDARTSASCNMWKSSQEFWEQSIHCKEETIPGLRKKE